MSPLQIKDIKSWSLGKLIIIPLETHPKLVSQLASLDHFTFTVAPSNILSTLIDLILTIWTFSFIYLWQFSEIIVCIFCL